jgi:hypothetical protein
MSIGRDDRIKTGNVYDFDSFYFLDDLSHTGWVYLALSVFTYSFAGNLAYAAPVSLLWDWLTRKLVKGRLLVADR